MKSENEREAEDESERERVRKRKKSEKECVSERKTLQHIERESEEDKMQRENAPFSLRG